MKMKNLIIVYLARTYQWVILMALINLSVYWTLWSMFLVIYYTAIMQFSIFSENSLYPLQKNCPIIQPLSKIKIFLPTITDFYYNFPYPFWEEGMHAMTLPNQLAPKQIINFQAIIAWLQNSIKSFIKIPIYPTNSDSRS